MREVWIAIAGVALASAGIKAIGPAFVGGRDLPERAVGVIALLAPALLTALVVTSTFSEARTLAPDARAVGVCVAALALALRAPMLVVVLLAAVSTSLVRALS
jgi:branched-subunit amino acid transport protein